MSVIKIEPVDGKITDEQINLMQQAFDAMAEGMNREVDQFMKEHPTASEACARDVVYLRTRSRHSRELEERLIKEHAAGTVINICDWPRHVDQGRPAFE